MAGDWIKVEETTPDKPEVQKMASILGIDPDAVTGKLIRVWVWASRSCNADGVTDVTVKALLDRVTCVTGFANSMLQVGWLEQDGDELRFPNFDYHNSQTAKTRAKSNKRVSEHRKRKRNCNGKSVTKAFQKALPEKRREEKNIINTHTAREREEDDEEFALAGSVVIPPCTRAEMDVYAGLTGIPDDVCQDWYERHEAEDWRPRPGYLALTTKSWQLDLKNYWKNRKAKDDERRNTRNGNAKAGKVEGNPRNSHLPDGAEEEARRVADMEDVRDGIWASLNYPAELKKFNARKFGEHPEYKRAIQWIRERNDQEGKWFGIYTRLAEQKFINELSGRWIADDR